MNYQKKININEYVLKEEYRTIHLKNKKRLHIH